MMARPGRHQACQACQKRHIACSWPTNPTTDGSSCSRCLKLEVKCRLPPGNPPYSSSCPACRKCHHRCVRPPGSPWCERCLRLGKTTCGKATSSLSSRSSTRSRLSAISSNDSFTPSGSILLSRTTSEALSHNGQQRLRAIGMSLPKLLDDVFEVYISGNKSAEAAVMILCMAGFKFNNAVEHAGGSRILPIDDVTVSSWLGGRLPKAESQRGNCDHLASRIGHILRESASGVIAPRDLPRILSVFRLYLKFKCSREPMRHNFREVLTTLVLETIVQLKVSNEGEAGDLRASAIQLACHEAEASVMSSRPSLITPKAYERLLSPHFESFPRLAELLSQHGTPTSTPTLCNIVKEVLEPCGRDILRLQRRLTHCWAPSQPSVDMLSTCFTQASTLCSILNSLRQRLVEAGVACEQHQIGELSRTLRSVLCIEICLVHTLVLSIVVGHRLAKTKPSLINSGQPYDLDKRRMDVVARLNRIVSSLIDHSTSLADYFHVLDMVTLAVGPDPSLWSDTILSFGTPERGALIQTLQAASFWDPGVEGMVNVLAGVA